MNTEQRTSHAEKPRARSYTLERAILLSLLAGLLTLGSGCAGAKKAEKKDEFFTSGSREADQRASQKMAQAEQLSGEGEGAGEEKVKKKKSEDNDGKGGSEEAPKAEEKQPLFDRLGGEAGLSAIVDDFTQRVLQDPRVNWQRANIKRGGMSFHRNQPVTWNASDENVAQLKKHLVQFFSLATGGPAHYEGKDIKSVHAGMHISNPEFDAAIGDLKASLDRLKVPNKEQKELLAIVESTRPQIVEER